MAQQRPRMNLRVRRSEQLVLYDEPSPVHGTDPFITVLGKRVMICGTDRDEDIPYDSPLVRNVIFAAHSPGQLPGIDDPSIRKLFLDMSDFQDNGITHDIMKETVKFYEETPSDELLFVYCHMGINRSVSVVLAWLVHFLEIDFNDAYARIKHHRACADPYLTFTASIMSLYGANGPHTADVCDCLHHVNKRRRTEATSEQDSGDEDGVEIR